MGRDEAVQEQIEMAPCDAVVAVVCAGVMHRVMFFREHDSVPLRRRDQTWNGGHVRPLVELVGHDHAGDKADDEHSCIRMRRELEEEERGNDHGKTHENIVGVDRDEVATGHLHGIDVVIAERLDELLADHRCLRRAEVVEQEMNDPRCKIRNRVGGKNEADDQQGNRKRHAIGDLIDHAPDNGARKADEGPDRDEFENSVTRWVVVGAQHTSIITTAGRRSLPQGA